MFSSGYAISHTANAVDYAREKLNAQELDRHMVSGETGQEIQADFQVFQRLNQRCDNNTLSFVISPTIEDGKQLSNSKLREISHDFLKEVSNEINKYLQEKGEESNIDLLQFQRISYVHTDKSHKHVHLYVNRINELGKATDVSFLKYKSGFAAEKVAQRYGLTTANEVKQMKIKKLAPEIKQIKLASKAVLRNCPKSIKEYTSQMKEYGILSHLKHDSKGNLVGLKFEIGDKMVKASNVSRNLSGKKILKTLADNALKLSPDPATKAIKIVKEIGKNLGKGISQSMG